MENDNNNNKRSRDDEGNETLPDSKRIREDFLFSILDDESEPDNTDIDSVMRSLEEEIAMPKVAASDSVDVSVSCSDPKMPDLGFLLEASDDELGLPPPETESAEIVGADVAASDDVEAVGFGKIWGIDEFDLGFGFGSEEVNVGGDDAVNCDGVLFESDFSELTWRTEYLPAV